MRGRRLVASLGWAAGLALFISLFQGEELVVSIELWLAVGCIMLAAAIVIDLLRNDPVDRPRLRGIWHKSWRRANSIETRPADLRVLEGILLRARDNERAYETHLQPRLQKLAAHHLPLSYGIDPQAQPEEAAAVLGDLSWLLGSGRHSRTPSLSELARFVSTVSNTRTHESGAQ